MTNRASDRAFSRSSGGVAMVEFSLVVIVVITFTLAVVDLGRFFALRYLVYQGVLTALDQAVKAPYLNLEPSAVSGTTRTNYISSMNTVLANVNRIGGTMVRPSTATSGSKFVSFSVSINGSTAAAKDAVLLAPGQCFYASDGYRARHPTTTCGASFSSSYEEVLRAHPLVVESRVLFKPFTPFLKTFTLQVRAAGFRELFVRGSGAAEVDLPINNNSSSSGSSSSSGGGSGQDPGGGQPTPAPPPACSKRCGANMVLVASSCTCYCGIGYCPRGTANPSACNPGCGG